MAWCLARERVTFSTRALHSSYAMVASVLLNFSAANFCMRYFGFDFVMVPLVDGSIIRLVE